MLGLGDGGDHVVELLELRLSEVSETAYFLIVVGLQLLVAEDHVLLSDVEDEAVEEGLLLPVAGYVLLQVVGVG